MVVLVLATSAVGRMAQAADSIVGTWRLVSWVEEETESKAQHKNFGDKPSGILTYTADGRMSVMFVDPSRQAPATPKATESEAANLYRIVVWWRTRAAIAWKATRSWCMWTSPGIGRGTGRIGYQ
jgi:hypothetical protein